MENLDDIVIVGGGLAGLACALHLLRLGFRVKIIEKNTYPHHKVCGEYISNEVLPYLKWLDADPFELNPSTIARLIVSTVKGQTIECELPLGGFGVSRFSLDNFLWVKAKQLGCKMITDTVNRIAFENGKFEINTNQNGSFYARIVIGAYGKRSVIDQKLLRPFIQKKSSWLAVKGHYKGEFPDDLVALHNFKGGYCGVSKVEDNKINICYLTDYNTFKKYKNIEAFEKHTLYRNPHLKQILSSCRPIFDQPLSISQISFEKKEPVYDHILMVGDTTGLIHPLCGNGMAMAVHSAKLCAELVVQYLNGEMDKDGGMSKGLSARALLENKYRKAWNENFKSRLATGRMLSGLVKKELLFESLLTLMTKFPSVLPRIIKRTHGQPIQ